MGAVGLACTFLAPEHQQGGSNGTSPSARPRLFTFIQNRFGPTIQLSLSSLLLLSCFVSVLVVETASGNSVSPFLGRREAFR